MYVINGEGVLVYKGGIDDQPTARLQDLKSARNFVDEAQRPSRHRTPGTNVQVNRSHEQNMQWSGM
jgi:hypothetical protein